MTNEELILQKLEKIEAQLDELQPIVKLHKNVSELCSDLAPLGKQAAHLVTKELQEIESGFQLEDVLFLIKKLARNTKNFGYALQQFESLLDFWRDLEPLLKLTVPQLISYLDKLEQKGVIRILKVWVVDFREKIADAYGPEDVEKIIDGIVAFIGLARGLSDPKAVDFLERASSLPSMIDIDNCEKVGPAGLAMGAAFNEDVKQGLGLVIELTKALGKLKANGSALQIEEPAGMPLN